MANGFFQLIHNAHGTSLKIVPPTNGGEMFPITELSDYLNARNLRFDFYIFFLFNKIFSHWSKNV